MKIQYLAVIFIIIILPISMVISYYVNAQIKTVSQQELYDAKLVTATYDSIRSFQLNTINSKYSSVSDSKIRDIEAGITSFFNSLGTELGATGYSREELSDFIPAILYSMYDGYYIYGKYYDASIEDFRIGLKPYVYYSCRYFTGSSTYNFVVNYTLDNTITIYGLVNGKKVTTSGALIKIGDYEHNANSLKTYTYITSTGNIVSNTIALGGNKYKKVQIDPEILSEKLIILDENNNPSTESAETYEYVTYKDQKIYIEKDEYGNVARDSVHKYYKTTNINNAGKHRSEVDASEIEEYPGIKCFFYNKNKKQYVTDIERIAYLEALLGQDSEGHTHVYSNSACQYYYDAYVFSNWVNDEIGDTIKQEHAYEVNDENEFKKITDFNVKTDGPIFNLEKEDPTLSSSTFNSNRIDVIQRSIKSNLSAEMANFNVNGYDYRMPQLTDTDWNKIVNNMCVTTFMQGMPIGMKYYNNYCVIPNDKNKEVVTEDSIYVLVDEDDTMDERGDIQAHYAGCTDLVDKSDKVFAAYRNIDFERQTVMTSGEPRYYYPHDDQKSYNCMVSGNGTYDLEEIIEGKIMKYSTEDDKYIEDTSKSSKISNLRKIYLTALAREKYDLYRTNGYFGVPVE